MFVKENTVFCMTKRKVPLSGHFGSRWTVATCIRCYFGCYCQGLSMFPAYGVAMQMQSLADIRAHYMLDGVELVCGVRRGPGARHQTPGGAASNGSFSIAGMCSTTRWFQSDSHSSSPCGISIQPGEENSSCKRWRGLGNMDGGTPFGDQAPPQTMAPASTTGPTSMERKLKVSQVLDQGDDGEFYVESEDTSYRWPTSWGRRTELGTAERFGTKDQNPGHSPLNGFWGFCSLWAKGTKDKQIPHLRLIARRVHRKRVARAFKLRPVEGMLQSVEIGPTHAGVRIVGQHPPLRDAHRKVDKAVRIGLAPGVFSGRPSEVSSCEQDEIKDTHGHQVGQEGTGRMGSNETMGHGLQAPGLRRKILAGTSPRTCTSMDCSWLEGSSEDAGREHTMASMMGGVQAIQPNVEATSSTAPTSTTPSSSKLRRDARKKMMASEREELKKYRSKEEGMKGKGKGKEQPKQLCYGWNNGNGPCASLSPGQSCVSKTPGAHRCTVCGSPGHPSRCCPQRKEDA